MYYLYAEIYDKMANDYESLLQSGLMSDVVLVAGEKEFRAHKLILAARSPVFSAMFANSSTKEAQESRVEIVDVDVEVLELMVRYIYTGKIEQLDQYAADLLVAADKYQLDRLKSICEQQLLSQISAESVSDLLLFADMYQATELNTKDLALKCLDYIINYGTQVIATEGWKKIVARPDLMSTVYHHLYTKYWKLIDDMRSQNYTEFLRLHNIKDEMVEYNKMDDGGDIDWTLVEDSEFQDYLVKYSNVIDLKEEIWDVVLVSGDKELKVHKKVLSARSSVFADMFTHETTNKKKNRVVISDVDEEVFKLLIKYVYTGKVGEELDRYAADLLVAADKYQLKDLKSICGQKLLSKVITIESVSELLILADIHQLAELYTKCFDYITQNSTQVIASDGWKKNIVVRSDLLTKLCEPLSLNFTEQRLLCPITIDSVLDLLILADIHHATELTSKCVEFIIDNVTEVMQQADWKKIEARGDLLAKLFERLSLKYTKVYSKVLDDARFKRYFYVDSDSESDSGSYYYSDYDYYEDYDYY